MEIEFGNKIAKVREREVQRTFLDELWTATELKWTESWVYILGSEVCACAVAFFLKMMKLWINSKGIVFFTFFNAFRCMNFEKISKNDKNRNFSSISMLKWEWKWKMEMKNVTDTMRHLCDVYGVLLTDRLTADLLKRKFGKRRPRYVHNVFK